MFAALAAFVLRRRRGLVLGWLAMLVPSLFLGAQVLTRLVPGGFEDPTRESWSTYARMQAELHAGAGDVLALYTTTGGAVDEPEVMGELLAVSARVERDPAVAAVDSIWSTGAPHFVSRDRTRTFLSIDLLGSDADKIAALARLTPLLHADGLTLQLGGLIPTNVAVFDTIRRDLLRAELYAFPLMALVVLVVFGSLASVFVMVVVGGSAIALAFAILRVLVEVQDVSIFAINTVTILGLGLAVDYSLFLINRFREELPARGVDGALRHTMQTTGRAVAFSGITVAVSLCGLFAFDQVLLRSLALGGVVVVAGVSLLSLTLVPALLAILGTRIDAWRVPGVPRVLQMQHGDVGASSPWARVARLVMRRPVVVTIAMSAVLLSLAMPYQRFVGSLADDRILPPSTPVRETHRVMRDAFMAQQSTPHLVLVQLDGDVFTRERLQALAELSDRIASIDGVARVDGVFSFIPGVSHARVIDALLDPTQPRSPEDNALLARFAKGTLMRFVVLATEPFDADATLRQVGALRALSTPSMKVFVAGYASALLDLRAAVHERAPWMVFGVMISMFIILFFLFGSVTLPIKAMVLNALSLTASFGAIVWVFQDGRLSGLLQYTPVGFSDSTQPLVMFATCFGLSMDYEVLILARIREEALKTTDDTAAIATGLARTGRLITSAAALLVLVVGAFATSEVLYMKALGIGMALAIAIDATVVRALLVPAAMKWMGRWNWWAPGPLRRWWQRSPMADLPE